MDTIALIQIETFTDLPAHPFLNRIAMYVVPTALLVALAALVRPSWRRGRRQDEGEDVPTRTSPTLAGMLAVVALAIAGNTYLTVMTAHTGSKSVYEEDGKLLTGETAEVER